LSYFLPFEKIYNDNSGIGISGLIYVFPLPLTIPIGLAFVPYAIPIVVFIVFATPMLILVAITKRLLLSSL
jgi:hypothetical protein